MGQNYTEFSVIYTDLATLATGENGCHDISNSFPLFIFQKRNSSFDFFLIRKFLVYETQVIDNSYN